MQCVELFYSRKLGIDNGKIKIHAWVNVILTKYFYHNRKVIPNLCYISEILIIIIKKRLLNF